MNPTVNSIQSWQESFVSNYLAQMESSLYPGYGSGRGYPDVAMMGNDYIVVTNESTSILSGTSASTPVFAGISHLVSYWVKMKC